MKAKSKMKMARQFQNEKIARYYEDKKIYRNNMKLNDVLIKLMEENPYFIDEIFDKEND